MPDINADAFNDPLGYFNAFPYINIYFNAKPLGYRIDDRHSHRVKYARDRDGRGARDEGSREDSASLDG